MPLRPIDDASPVSPGDYALLQAVERLESLAEEMEELGVSTLAEVQARIAALHQALDARE